MNIEQLLLISFVLLCILPLISLLIIGVALFFFSKRLLGSSLDPSVDRLYAQYTALYEQDPQQPLDEHIQKIIRQESIKAGVVGAITGLGGFFTLPIALPIDLLLSMRLQISLVQFIARAYGFDESERDTRFATYLMMSRSGDVTRMSVRVIMRYAVRIVGKSFSKLIPFVGAAVSFLVNYVITRTTARAAQSWYRQRSKQAPNN